jgi:ABC-type transporter Mla subunit MlaD
MGKTTRNTWVVVIALGAPLMAAVTSYGCGGGASTGPPPPTISVTFPNGNSASLMQGQNVVIRNV